MSANAFPMSLFIGIDSGTQSTKAIVLDLESRTVIAEARAPHALISGLPVGHMEQHPLDWTVALDAVLRRASAPVPGDRYPDVGAFVHAWVMACSSASTGTAPVMESATPFLLFRTITPGVPGKVTPATSYGQAVLTGRQWRPLTYHTDGMLNPRCGSLARQSARARFPIVKA
mgnify:CR=1 FL=1